MIIPHKEHRIGIFIDVQNLYHSAKNLYGGRVNYGELIKKLTGERKLVRALGYVVRSDPETGEESFFEALQKAGIELRMKDIQIFPSGGKKADWDVGLAVDGIRMADSLDVAILVSGDGDFIPLVKYLQIGLGKGVEVAAFGKTASSGLKEVADNFIDLDTTPRMVFKSAKSSARKKKMDLNRQKFAKEIGGENLIIETSNLAEQTNAAVTATYGGTTVLATVVMEDRDSETDYMPLTVDYEEKFYAAGKILGSRFVRREGKPSEEAVLSGRLVDRTVRPLFDRRGRRPTQGVATGLS